MQKQARRARRDFLQIDSEIGLTFSSIALTANDEDKRRRNTQTARKAYDTVTRLKNDINLSDAEKAALDHNLLRLKKELQCLGEKF
jgi:hypothetical protein